MTPPSGAQIELAHGDQRVWVVEVGGGLRRYTAGGADVLDGYGEREVCSGGRGQLLLPWPNRIRAGRYGHDGAEHQLSLTEPTAGNAIHGSSRAERRRNGEATRRRPAAPTPRARRA